MLDDPHRKKPSRPTPFWTKVEAVLLGVFLYGALIGSVIALFR